MSAVSAVVAVVVVVGGGLAGLCASIEAARAGARVILIDKEANAKATSGMNACPTDAQAEASIADTAHAFLDDTVRSGGGRTTLELARALVDESAEAWRFIESGGVALRDVILCGGHSQARTHRVKPGADGKPVPVGWTIVSRLRGLLTQAPLNASVTIMTKTRALELVTRDGAVRGVRVKNSDTGVEETLSADAVVLATGGYAAAAQPGQMLAQHAPSACAFPSTNGPFATGDGIALATAVGAATVDLDQVQVHPTGFFDLDNPTARTVILGPEALRGCGGVLVNRRGSRFVNELGTRLAVTTAMLAEYQRGTCGTAPAQSAYLIMSEAMREHFGAGAFAFYASKKLIRPLSFDSCEEQFGIDPKELRATLQAYNAAARGEAKDAFGKTAFPATFDAIENGPLYLAAVTPSVHYCMGGVRFNAGAQVLTEADQPIAGLFAAGEVTGGLHGGNRLAGNSLLECVVFGRRAGRAAAAAAAAQPAASEPAAAL